MAKRRAEDILLHGSPSKRCCAPPRCCVDTPLQNVVPPPSLLALFGSRCSSKRPRYSQDMEKQEETTLNPAKHAACDVTALPPGSFQKRHSSSYAATNCTKRPRMDSGSSETIVPKITTEDGEDTNTEDSAYNSFQFWRVPLPELDLSLLEDATEDLKTKEKSKVRGSSVSSDAMET